MFTFKLNQAKQADILFNGAVLETVAFSQVASRLQTLRANHAAAVMPQVAKCEWTAPRMGFTATGKHVSRRS